jgi:hypothetical protein
MQPHQISWQKEGELCKAVFAGVEIINSMSLACECDKCVENNHVWERATKALLAKAGGTI